MLMFKTVVGFGSKSGGWVGEDSEGYGWLRRGWGRGDGFNFSSIGRIVSEPTTTKKMKIQYSLDHRDSHPPKRLQLPASRIDSF